MRRLLSPHKWRQVHCEATASAPLIVNIFTFKSILLQHQFLASVTAIVAQEQELAEISGQLPTQLPWLRQLPPRLLRLPSPPPESGRRQVTAMARMDALTFSTLNALCNKSNGRCDIKAEKIEELESKSSHKSDIWLPAASKK